MVTGGSADYIVRAHPPKPSLNRPTLVQPLDVQYLFLRHGSVDRRQLAVRCLSNAAIPRARHIHVRVAVAQPAKLDSRDSNELLNHRLILLGLLVSYLPQHYRIISRGTAEGISPYFVLLGTTSATAGFANILTVPPSRAAMSCCKEIESFECAAGMLGIAQLGAQWLCFSLMYACPTLFLCSLVGETN